MPDFPFGSTVLVLAPGQQGNWYPFTVPADAEQDGVFFVRIIALWHDDTPSDGDAPTIEISAGDLGPAQLVVTPQGSPTAPVEIPGDPSAPAGIATCEREPRDLYFVTITNPLADRPWQLRIINNETQPDRTLGFVAVSSVFRDDTLQPWLVWGAAPNSLNAAGDGDVSFTLDYQTRTHPITVRNLGTAPLQFTDPLQPSPIPPTIPGSPLVLTALPAKAGPGLLDVHGFDTVVFGINAQGTYTDYGPVGPFQLTTADTATPPQQPRGHTPELTVDVGRTNFPPPPPGQACNVDHCAGYVPPPPYDPNGNSSGGPCVQPGCGHGDAYHGFGPLCRVDPPHHCPGFKDSAGAAWGITEATTVCVQSGCGHDWDDHGRPPPPPPMPCSMCGCANWRPPRPPGTGCATPGCGHSIHAHEA